MLINTTIQQDLLTTVSGALGNFDNLVNILVQNEQYDLNDSLDSDITNPIVLNSEYQAFNTSGITPPKEEEKSDTLIFKALEGQTVFDISINTYFDLNNIINLLDGSEITSVNDTFNNKKTVNYSRELIADAIAYNKIFTGAINFSTWRNTKTNNFLLQENGFYLLQENGYKIIL